MVSTRVGKLRVLDPKLSLRAMELSTERTEENESARLKKARPRAILRLPYRALLPFRMHAERFARPLPLYVSGACACANATADEADASSFLNRRIAILQVSRR
jgi:hypothetical protein